MGFTFVNKQFGVKVVIHCAEINTCVMTGRPTDTLTAGSGATEHARQLSVTKNRASVKTRYVMALVERWFLDSVFRCVTARAHPDILLVAGEVWADPATMYNLYLVLEIITNLS